tara:strand:- start:146 stop:565 length:420 start_codon:yes stop_codon:yes gene_type:complete
MAQINVAPIILRDVLLRFSYGEGPTTSDFEKHVSQVELTPSASTVTWKGLTPTAVFTDTGFATWTCSLSFAQDWETTDSLSQFLYDHEGEKLDVLFEPVSGGAGWESTITISPGAIGGSVDSVAVATVTLGCTRPTRAV